MRRLSLTIYLTIILSLLAVVLVAGGMWRRVANAIPVQQMLEVAGQLVVGALPSPEAPAAEQRQAVTRLANRLSLDLALFDASRAPVAAVGAPLPKPPLNRDHSGFIRGQGGAAVALALPDGRWLVARTPRQPLQHPALALVAFLGAIALIVALSAWPVVRGLTRRLERLQQSVEALGSGDLTARVKVEGRDEVARLAHSFNRSAQRIEELVGAHKMLLANASHELRTPLSRIRLGLELMDERADAARPDATRKEALQKDIAELDGLIDEILTASRLEAMADLELREDVDLLALAAEECARYRDCVPGGKPVVVRGDPRLLRRLVRNLLENAHRHGAPPVVVEVIPSQGQALLTVSDHGPGIPAPQREHVFEPFRKLPGPDSSHGTGLGLALVRQIARRHGGAASIADHPLRKGASRFEIRLPAN